MFKKRLGFGSSQSDSEEHSPPSFIKNEGEFTKLVQQAKPKKSDDRIVAAQQFLFNRKTSVSRSMVQVTELEKQQEQECMNLLANAFIRDISDTYGSLTSDELTDVPDKKKELKKTQDQSIELFREGNDVFMFDGDVHAFENETLKRMTEKGLIRESADCLRIVGQLTEMQDDLRGAYRMYENCCSVYESLGLMDFVKQVRMHDIGRLCTYYELYELLAENYELVLKFDQDPLLKSDLEFLTIMLRLVAFLKGEGTESTVEIKDRVEHSTSLQHCDLLIGLLKSIEYGDREVHHLDVLDNWYVQEELEFVYDNVVAACKRYI
jgi:hypothetical protein